MTAHTRTKFLFFWFLLTFVGVVMSTALWVSRQTAGPPLSIPEALYSHVVRMQFWAALAPLIVWFDHRLSRNRRLWGRQLVMHLMTATVVAAAVHTLLFGTLTWGLGRLGVFEPSALSEVLRSMWVSNTFVGIIVYKMILTTHLTFDYYLKYREEQLRAASLETQLADARLHALRMQLHPHFLFNTLNSISSLILDDPHAAVRMVSRLGDFLRLTLEHDGRVSVRLDEEMEFLERYLEIEKVRFRDRLRVEISVDPAVAGARIPSLILQPVIENAIKHGIARRAAAGLLEIRARASGATLRIEISDDGPGLVDPASCGNGHGVGLANARTRLAGMYGDRSRISLSPRRGGGATAVVEMPLAVGLGGLNADN